MVVDEYKKSYANQADNDGIVVEDLGEDDEELMDELLVEKPAGEGDEVSTPSHAMRISMC